MARNSRPKSSTKRGDGVNPITIVNSIEKHFVAWRDLTGDTSSSALDSRPLDERGFPKDDVPEVVREARTHVIEAIGLWRQLTDKILNWALRDSAIDDMQERNRITDREKQTKFDRETLAAALLESFMCRHPGPVAIPAIRHDIAVALYEALMALPKGEVQPLLWPSGKPNPKPKTGIVRARQEALESIAYLEGKGWTVIKAQEEVGSVYGVSREAVRKWEQESKWLGARSRGSAYLAGLQEVGFEKDSAAGKFEGWCKKRMSKFRSNRLLNFEECWQSSSGILIDSIKDYAGNGREYRAALKSAAAKRTEWD